MLDERVRLPGILRLPWEMESVKIRIDGSDKRRHTLWTVRHNCHALGTRRKGLNMGYTEAVTYMIDSGLQDHHYWIYLSEPLKSATAKNNRLQHHCHDELSFYNMRFAIEAGRSVKEQLYIF